MERDREYLRLKAVRCQMIDRCTKPHHPDYDMYGARGIRVCQRWLDSLQDFLIDMGPRPEGYYIDRIDNDGNYCPENCRWTDPTTSGRNKRNNRMITADGRTQCLTAWAEELGCDASNLLKRYKRHGRLNTLRSGRSW